MRNQLFKIVLFGLVSLIFACEHEPIEPEPENLTLVFSDNSCDPDSVYFEIDVLPILRSNCAFGGCHGAGSSEGGVELSSYDNVMSTADVRPGDPNGSDLYEVIIETDLDKRMPEPPNEPLSSVQIDLIRKWIEQGAKNITCDDCDTTNVTFSKNVKPIIQNNCQGCHSGSNAPYGILLTNYNEINTRVQTGQLLGAIRHEPIYFPMPLGQPKLNQCLIDQIVIWVENGANDD